MAAAMNGSVAGGAMTRIRTIEKGVMTRIRNKENILHTEISCEWAKHSPIHHVCFGIAVLRAAEANNDAYGEACADEENPNRVAASSALNRLKTAGLLKLPKITFPIARDIIAELQEALQQTDKPFTEELLKELEKCAADPQLWETLAAEVRRGRHSIFWD